MYTISNVIRREFKKNDDRRDAGLNTPGDVLRFDDLVYGNDHVWQVLDIYRPKEKGNKKLPVIVSVHGGGWVYGSKETYQFYCMSLAQRGFAVVNFSYRLAPENKFPAPIEDLNSVLYWMIKHAEQYGLDLDHVFAVGDSAGAHSLALYACLCANEDYARHYRFSPPEEFRFSAIALNCGNYMIESKPRDFFGSLTECYLPNEDPEAELRLLQIMDFVTKDFPPSFIMTSNDDFLREQAPLMAQALMLHQVPFVFRFYGDAQKKLGHVFHCDVRSADAGLCNDEECAFFREFC